MGSCIEHKGCVNNMGYGQVRIKGKTLLAHRVSYATYNNVSLASMEGLVVRHTCDNPKCINPNHLIIGTQLDNMKDKVSRGRQAYNEAHWNTKLSSESVDWIRKNCIKRHKTLGCIPVAKKFGVSPSLIKAILRGEKRNNA